MLGDRSQRPFGHVAVDLDLQHLATARHERHVGLFCVLGQRPNAIDLLFDLLINGLAVVGTVQLRFDDRAALRRRCADLLDAVETAEAWELALGQSETPSVLSLTRQGLPTVRTAHSNKNLTAQGAYVLADADGKRQAILLATGSEVAIAMAARAALQAEGIGTRVVSMPCWELFEQQPDVYRRRVLPGGPVRVAVEAGVRLGWDRWLFGERGKREKAGFVGMHGFGGSAPASELYRDFGITAEAVAEKAKTLLEGKWSPDPRT